MSARRCEDLSLTARIAAIHRRSLETYGAPNIHAALADEHGIRVGRKRVARLMRESGLQGATLRKYVVTTLSDPQAKQREDLVERRFFANAPDRLWVADITYIPTWSGWLYLAMVLDVYSRKIVGWAMDTHMRTELILDALQMAVTQRQPRGVIHLRTTDRNARVTPSESAAGKRASWPRWDRSATPTTMQWPRASSPPSSAHITKREQERQRFSRLRRQTHCRIRWTKRHEENIRTVRH